MPSIYIINPASSPPSYYTAEAYADEDGGWVQVADLAIVTVAALTPQGWDIRIADEAITPVDLDAEVDFVAITGKVTQRDRMIELSREFRRRGRTVLIGGSFASLSPAEMRPYADILVTGEIEELAPTLFGELESGTWRDRYHGGQADIRLSPLPRWDLYPVGRALSGALQTTRGCPFNCEFCDVIQYQGRKQRHKNLEQVIAELDLLYKVGFRRIFLVDDNFTVHRAWARTVLDALTQWNREHADDPVSFVTQASIDIARDEEMLARCRSAGLRSLFVGVETINEDSLRETGKKQNLLQPVNDALAKILGAGIAVQAGVIVGFDHDGPDIFETLFDFLQASPLSDPTVGVLVAPQATDLFRRLQAEGRLLGSTWEGAGLGPFSTNIVPKLMSRGELLSRTLQLCETLYSAEAYKQRMMNLIDAFGADEEGAAQRGITHANAQNRLFFRSIKRTSARGSAEASMVSEVLKAASRKPAVLPVVMQFLLRYDQARYFLDWGTRTLAAA